MTRNLLSLLFLLAFNNIAIFPARAEVEQLWVSVGAGLSWQIDRDGKGELNTPANLGHEPATRLATDIVYRIAPGKHRFDIGAPGYRELRMFLSTITDGRRDPKSTFSSPASCRLPALSEAATISWTGKDSDSIKLPKECLNGLGRMYQSRMMQSWQILAANMNARAHRAVTIKEQTELPTPKMLSLSERNVWTGSTMKWEVDEKGAGWIHLSRGRTMPRLEISGNSYVQAGRYPFQLNKRFHQAVLRQLAPYMDHAAQSSTCKDEMMATDQPSVSIAWTDASGAKNSYGNTLGCPSFDARIGSVSLLFGELLINGQLAGASMVHDQFKVGALRFAGSGADERSLLRWHIDRDGTGEVISPADIGYHPPVRLAADPQYHIIPGKHRFNIGQAGYERLRNYLSTITSLELRGTSPDALKSKDSTCPTFQHGQLAELSWSEDVGGSLSLPGWCLNGLGLATKNQMFLSSHILAQEMERIGHTAIIGTFPPDLPIPEKVAATETNSEPRYVIKWEIDAKGKGWIEFSGDLALRSVDLLYGPAPVNAGRHAFQLDSRFYQAVLHALEPYKDGKGSEPIDAKWCKNGRSQTGQPVVELMWVDAKRTSKTYTSDRGCPSFEWRFKKIKYLFSELFGVGKLHGSVLLNEKGLPVSEGKEAIQ
jgi:hypothetical protein